MNRPQALALALLSMSASAANASCAGAIAIGDGQDQPFDTTYATTSGLRLTGCDGETTMLNEIYYTYTPAHSGKATITTCGTGWDTILAVFDRCGGRIIACNDDDTRFVCFQSSGQSVVKFQAVAGRTYTVAVGASLVWDEGRGVFNVSTVAPPGCAADMNDDGFVDMDDYIVFLCALSPVSVRPGATRTSTATGSRTSSTTTLSSPPSRAGADYARMMIVSGHAGHPGERSTRSMDGTANQRQCPGLSKYNQV